jgi:hypothetical protein
MAPDRRELHSRRSHDTPLTALARNVAKPANEKECSSCTTIERSPVLTVGRSSCSVPASSSSTVIAASAIRGAAPAAGRLARRPATAATTPGAGAATPATAAAVVVVAAALVASASEARARCSRPSAPTAARRPACHSGPPAASPSTATTVSAAEGPDAGRLATQADKRRDPRGLKRPGARSYLEAAKIKRGVCVDAGRPRRMPPNQRGQAPVRTSSERHLAP